MSSSNASLWFSDSFSTEALFLVEIDDSLVEAIEQGNCFIKETSSGHSVFVTDSITFDMKKQENSNTSYVIIQDENNSRIVGEIGGTIVLEKKLNPAIIFPSFLPNCIDINSFEFHNACSNMEFSNYLQNLGFSSTFLTCGNKILRITEDKRVYLTDLLLSACNLVGKCDDERNYDLESVWLCFTENLGDDDREWSDLELSRSLLQPLCVKAITGRYFVFEEIKVLKFRLYQVTNRLKKLLQEGHSSFPVDYVIEQWSALVLTSAGCDQYLVESRDLSKLKSEVLVLGKKDLFVVDENNDRIIPFNFGNLEIPIGPREHLKRLFELKKTWNFSELYDQLGMHFKDKEFDFFLSKNARLVDGGSSNRKEEQVYAKRF